MESTKYQVHKKTLSAASSASSVDVAANTQHKADNTKHKVPDTKHKSPLTKLKVLSVDILKSTPSASSTDTRPSRKESPTSVTSDQSSASPALAMDNFLKVISLSLSTKPHSATDIRSETSDRSRELSPAEVVVSSPNKDSDVRSASFRGSPPSRVASVGKVAATAQAREPPRAAGPTTIEMGQSCSESLPGKSFSVDGRGRSVLHRYIAPGYDERGRKLDTRDRDENILKGRVVEVVDVFSQRCTPWVQLQLFMTGVLLVAFFFGLLCAYPPGKETPTEGAEEAAAATTSSSSSATTTSEPATTT